MSPKTLSLLLLLPLGVSVMRSAPPFFTDTVPSAVRLLLICIAAKNEDVPSELIVALKVEESGPTLNAALAWYKSTVPDVTSIPPDVIRPANEESPFVCNLIRSVEPSFIVNEPVVITKSLFTFMSPPNEDIPPNEQVPANEESAVDETLNPLFKRVRPSTFNAGDATVVLVSSDAIRFLKEP